MKQLISVFVTLMATGLSFASPPQQAEEFTLPGLFTLGIEGPASDKQGRLYAVNFHHEGSIGVIDKQGKVSHFIDLPDSAFREADQLSSLMLNYKSSAWNWNLTAAYQGEAQTLAETAIAGVNRRNTLDDFWVVNSKLGYQITPAVGLHLQIKNLLDKDYFSPAQGNGIAYGTPNRGRETSIAMEWHW